MKFLGFYGHQKKLIDKINKMISYTKSVQILFKPCRALELLGSVSLIDKCHQHTPYDFPVCFPACYIQ